jgi:hypothetical protein
MSNLNVRADVLLRALAITAVTYNHAHPYSTFALGWGGGMTFLLMLSGYNFAKFAMNGATPEQTRARLVRLGWRIFVPSLAAVVFFFILLRKFDLAELLFYRNWLTPQRIAKFATWYPQVIVQMFAGLYVLFSIPSLARAILRWPVQASLCIFLLGVLIRAAFPVIWDTAWLHHHLPHLFLWNFTLGWLVYFSTTQLPAPWGKLLAVAGAALGGIVGFGMGYLDFWWLCVGVLLLVLPLDVRLPAIPGRLVLLISQATFAIFLLHRFVYEVYEHLPIPQQNDAMWIIGLAGSLGLWMGGSALIRAYRTLRQREITPQSAPAS